MVEGTDQGLTVFSIGQLGGVQGTVFRTIIRFHGKVYASACTPMFSFDLQSYSLLAFRICQRCYFVSSQDIVIIINCQIVRSSLGTMIHHFTKISDYHSMLRKFSDILFCRHNSKSGIPMKWMGERITPIILSLQAVIVL